MGKHGYIYLLREVGGNRVKIGKSTRQPNKRIAEYSPLLPFETEVVHTFECIDVDWAEYLMHSTFEGDRIRGEWFWLDDANVKYIQDGAYDDFGKTSEGEFDHLVDYYGAG